MHAGMPSGQAEAHPRAQLFAVPRSRAAAHQAVHEERSLQSDPLPFAQLAYAGRIRAARTPAGRVRRPSRTSGRPEARVCRAGAAAP